jgi:predicted  nucleic acid-binding Zn-ribbon protein
MNVPELTLHHQRLDLRATNLRAQIERVQGQLATDPESERLEAERATGEAFKRDVEARLRERERTVSERRERLRGRQRELMSGRIRNPTELMKLNEEVEHLKTAVGSEEDAQLELMEEQERADGDLVRVTAALSASRERTATAAPDLRTRLEGLEADLAQTEAEREATWAQIPPDWQEAYRRGRRRGPDPVAEVLHGQCQACRVAVTSSGMQQIRRGVLITCDNCNRILVVA